MILRFLLALFYFSFTTIFLHSQNYGCTDPRAINYNPGAVLNDGSCIYTKTYTDPEIIIKNLPEEIAENSGMISFQGLNWFLNDSGGKPELYGYDIAKMQIMRKIIVKNATNHDWEALTADDHYIYIGDFGNNLGNRKDLMIYRIDKQSVPTVGNVSVVYDSIMFNYSDQSNFTASDQNHDYDCEAFIVVDDSCYLFSKNWKSQNTKVYIFPAFPGSYSPDVADSFNVDGLITDACINIEKTNLVLLGYKNYQPFFWVIFDFKDNDFFSGNKRRIDMPAIILFQTESVNFSDENTILLSSEKTIVTANRLFKINIGSWGHQDKQIVEYDVFDKTQIKIFPNPCRNELFITVSDTIKENITATLTDTNGKTVLIKNIDFSKKQLEKLKIRNLSPGNYILRLQSGTLYYCFNVMVINH